MQMNSAAGKEILSLVREGEQSEGRSSGPGAAESSPFLSGAAKDQPLNDRQTRHCFESSGVSAAGCFGRSFQPDKWLLCREKSFDK